MDLQRLAKNLQENLDSQQALDRNFDIYDTNSEKVILNLQHLESEERAYKSRYDRLLRGIGIESENQDSEIASAPENEPANIPNDDPESLEKLRHRRESFLENLQVDFENLEEKLASIEKLRKELEDSRNEMRQKKGRALEQKEALEEQGKKLLNEVGRLESELETTIFEEKGLIEESIKMVQQVESSLELNEEIDHILFSSLTLAESAESPAENEPANDPKPA
jgi:chromosome segregation ATPase